MQHVHVTERKKKERQWKKPYSGICRHHPRHQIKILHSGWSLGDSSKFWVSWKSIKHFLRCGGSKFGCPIALAIGLYNYLNYHTGPDYSCYYYDHYGRPM